MHRRTTALLLGLTLTLTGAFAAADSVRVTSEELHRGGGVPPGWKFTVPRGDPAKGKEVFAALECYSCHVVEGAGFPPKASDKNGPALSRMGAHHPAEYFAESILDPNAVIIDAPGFYGPDGRSTMPSYNDSLTLEQWVNLVAYLKSLTDDGGHGGHAPHAAAGASAGHEMHGGHGGHGPEREQTVGEYRVRLDYAEPEAARRPGYLRVAIADAGTGQPVPYLPVRARVGAGRAARSIRLAPALDANGPHYGASVVVPDETETVTVLVGAATVRITGLEKGRYRTPRAVSFEW